MIDSTQLTRWTCPHGAMLMNSQGDRITVCMAKAKRHARSVGFDHCNSGWGLLGWATSVLPMGSTRWGCTPWGPGWLKIQQMIQSALQTVAATEVK